MRVWLFALSMIVALTSGPTVSASPLGLTDCQVNPQPSMNSDSGEISKALVQIAGVVAAHERNNQPAEIAEAKEVATAIAKLQPQDIVGILNIFEELREIGRLSHEASLQIAHALISDIDPVARQRSEVDVHPLRAYLKALEWIIADNSENWMDKFEKIETNIIGRVICNERVFFLFLEIAEHIGYHYAPERARSRLEALIERAKELTGTSVTETPLKWYAYQSLTAVTVRLCLFDLALPMLERSQKEAKMVLSTPMASAETREWVEAAMENFPEYVAQEHSRAATCRLSDAAFEACPSVRSCRDR